MKQHPAPNPQLPQTICMRITRRCNAKCRFCLAPDNEIQPGEADLMRRIEWLLSKGIRSIHFCGGEPTMHPALSRLLTYAHARGTRPKLTTNGIALTPDLLPVLRATDTRVKLSLHGPPEYHNHLVGRETFHHTAANLHRLLGSRVSVSVQTTVVDDDPMAAEWMVAYCLRSGVRRLSILPAIPRGRGRDGYNTCRLTSNGRQALRKHITKLRRSLNGRLDLRWLDFAMRPVHVLDADGRLLLESMTESMDKELYRLE